MFLSIIAPVYNTSKYLAKCVDSLLNQGLDASDYEIVLVNDGSTDNSLEICRDYASRNPQVRVIDKPNGGVTSARNKGLDEAKGDFVCFVDSDDYLVEGGFGYLKEHFDCENYELVRFWSAIEATGSDRPKTVEGKVSYAGTGLGYIEVFGLEAFCYVSLYRLDFLRRHDIRFKPYTICDDTAFATSVLLANPKMLATTSRIYRYVIHDGTITTTRKVAFMRRCVESQLDVHDEIMDKVESLGLSPDSVVVQHAVGHLHSMMPFLISRALSARLSVSEFRQLAARCHNRGLWPLPFYKQMTRKVRAYSSVINFLDRHPRFFPVASFLYAKIFVPYFLKNIDRNYL